MTEAEILIFVLSLLIGWVGVSLLIDRKSREDLPLGDLISNLAQKSGVSAKARTWLEWSLCLALLCFFFLPLLVFENEPGRNLNEVDLWGNFVCQILMVLGLFFAYLKLGRWQELGLGSRLPLAILYWPIVLYLVILAFSASLELMGWGEWNRQRFGNNLQDSILLLQKNQDPKVVVAMVCTAVIGAALVEELFFRGLLFRLLRNRFGFHFAAIISSLIFALVHGKVYAMPPLFLLAWLFAYLFQRYQNLWVPIICHAFFNAVMIAMTIIASKSLTTP